MLRSELESRLESYQMQLRSTEDDILKVGKLIDGLKTQEKQLQEMEDNE